MSCGLNRWMCGLAGLLLVACDDEPADTSTIAPPSSIVSDDQPSQRAAETSTSVERTPAEAGGEGPGQPSISVPDAGGSSQRAAAGSSGAAASTQAAAAETQSQDAGAPDAATAPDASTQSVRPIADDGWPLGSPEEFSIDASKLDALALELQQASGNTRAGVVVVKEGVLIYEKYWDGAADTLHQVFSCTKSWGSTLVGIAVHKGLISVDDPVTKWVPQPAREVGTGALVKHLLTQTAHTTPPGTEFAYNSGSIINTLPEILEAASGMSSLAFFQSTLAEPLGLGMEWPSCGAGGCAGTRYKADYIQFGDQGPNAVLRSTIRDQAKLGWLWLDDGVWNGERLLDSEYIKTATEPSFDFQSVYGFLWWLNREGMSSVISYDPKVPDDMYHAVGGIGNCSVAVLPTQRLVIAHVGSLDGGGLGGHWDVFEPLY